MNTKWGSRRQHTDTKTRIQYTQTVHDMDDCKAAYHSHAAKTELWHTCYKCVSFAPTSAVFTACCIFEGRSWAEILHCSQLQAFGCWQKCEKQVRLILWGYRTEMWSRWILKENERQRLRVGCVCRCVRIRLNAQVIPVTGNQVTEATWSIFYKTLPEQLLHHIPE